jgi:hypothetical protein
MVRSDWHLEQFIETSGKLLVYHFTITIHDYLVKVLFPRQAELARVEQQLFHLLN